MANNPDSILLTISDMVSKSIKNRSLHIDYNDILDMCREQKISSYALHQIIEHELVRKETISNKIDKKTIGFVRLVMPEVTPDDTVIENKDGRLTKSLKDTVSKLSRQLADRDKRIADLSLNLEETKRKKRRRVWPYWIVIVLLFLSMVTLLYVILTDSQLKHELDILLPFK